MKKTTSLLIALRLYAISSRVRNHITRELIEEALDKVSDLRVTTEVS